MIIESLTVCNFGAYRGDQKLSPSRLDSMEGGITLIGGMNGYGKTSLLEAMLLVLYGRRSPIVQQQSRRYSTYLRELVHRGVPGEAETFVELAVLVPGEDRDSLLQIRRSWTRDNLRRSEQLTVHRDGVEDSFLSDHWDSYVEELVPSAISGLFFFDGERISELAQAEDTADALRKAIRALLGIETVDRLIADLGVVIRRQRTRLKDRKIRDELAQLSREATEAQTLRDRAVQRVSELENAIAKARIQCNKLDEERARSGGDLVAGRAQLEVRREKLRTSLAEIRAEIGVLIAGPFPLLLVHPILSRVQETAQIDDSAFRARAALPILREHDSKTLKVLHDFRISSDVLSELETQLEVNRSEVVRLAEQDQIFPLSPAGAAQLTDLMTSAFCNLREQAEELVRRHGETESELDRVERYLQSELDRADGADVTDELAQARLRLAELESEQARLKLDVEAHTAARDAIERRIATVGSKVAEIEEAERIVLYAARSQETMRVFRERLTRSKMTQLGREILDAFARLTHKEGLVADLRVDPNDLRIVLLDGCGHEIPKSRLSSGERQMLAVAILWGLARASGQTLPVMIDTPMARLDSSHRQTFVSEYLPHASHQVIVLSTDTEIVGESFESLREHVGRMYRLEFDDTLQETRIVEGYFQSVGR